MTSSCPYASNSVGPLRGSLRIGGKIRTLQCFAACGDARKEFNGFISDIKIYLRNNLSRVSTQELVISLYMIGKQPSRTKPTILFASDDKAIRKEALNLIKRQSMIMEDHQGFELGHIPLKAEFEGLKQMADGSDSSICWPQDVPFHQYEDDESPCHDIHFTSKTQDGHVLPAYLTTATASGLIQTVNPGCKLPVISSNVSKALLTPDISFERGNNIDRYRPGLKHRLSETPCFCRRRQEDEALGHRWRPRVVPRSSHVPDRTTPSRRGIHPN